MEQRVLIVSDSPDRRAYLEFHLNALKLQPVWYPNILAARMAARSDPFAMILVDLCIPLEPKLALIGDCVVCQPDAMVVSIGKTGYLEKEKLLPNTSSIVRLSNIEAVRIFVKEWLGKQA